MLNTYETFKKAHDNEKQYISTILLSDEPDWELIKKLIDKAEEHYNKIKWLNPKNNEQPK